MTTIAEIFQNARARCRELGDTVPANGFGVGTHGYDLEVGGVTRGYHFNVQSYHVQKDQGEWVGFLYVVKRNEPGSDGMNAFGATAMEALVALEQIALVWERDGANPTPQSTT